jgi:hypothetical protein
MMIYELNYAPDGVSLECVIFPFLILLGGVVNVLIVLCFELIYRACIITANRYNAIQCLCRSGHEIGKTSYYIAFRPRTVLYSF